LNSMTDLILFNANVITLDPAMENAGLVAVKNGRIQAVSSNDALRDLKQGARPCCPDFVMPIFTSGLRHRTCWTLICRREPMSPQSRTCRPEFMRFQRPLLPGPGSGRRATTSFTWLKNGIPPAETSMKLHRTTRLNSPIAPAMPMF